MSLDKRAAIGYVDVTGLEQEHGNVYNVLQQFKFNMTRIIRGFTNQQSAIIVPPVEAAKLADLFDSRLFWRTYNQISKSHGEISADWFKSQPIKLASNKNDQKR